MFRQRVVCICVCFEFTTRLHQLTKGGQIDPILPTYQIPRLIMAEEGTFGEGGNSLAKGFPVASTITLCHFRPVDIDISTLCVASLDLEGAGVGAGSLMGGGNGHDSRLTISALNCQSKVAHDPLFRLQGYLPCTLNIP